MQISAQLACRVFIKQHDANHWANPSLSWWCSFQCPCRILPGVDHMQRQTCLGQTLAMPSSISMIMNSLVHRQMSHSLICSDRTVACLVRTSLPQQLWRPFKTMSLIITRYVVYISLLLTCGGHGSTIRAREITNQLWRISHCDDTRRVSPFRPEGPAPPLRCRRFAYGYALDGPE